MSTIPRVTEAEWELMEVIWGRDSVTVQEIMVHMKSHKPWKEQTIRTMLTRLEKKGALACDDTHRPIRYSARVTRASLIQKSKNNFFQRVLEGTNLPVLVELVRHTKMSEAEIEELREILEEKKGDKTS